MLRALVTGVALVAAIVVGAPDPASAESSATVRVDANAFAPFEAAVDVGGTVTWIVQEGGHTIAADDGRFRLRGSGGSTLPAGSAVSATFARDEIVAYHCEIHGGAGGQGMAGRIRVGSPAAPAPVDGPVIRVPEDRATLSAAVAAAAPGHRIDLGPGDHALVEPVTIAIDGVTVVGRDSTTRLLPAAGPRGFPTTALHVTSSHVRIERLKIGAFRTSGVLLDGANGAELVDVRIDGEGFTLDGIVAVGITGVRLQRTTTTGNRNAGVRITACPACGALVDDVLSAGNRIGLTTDGARGVIVRGSRLESNRIGISARATRETSPLRPAVVTLVNNDIEASTETGVLLSGAADSLVSGNRVVGSGRGIVVAGDVAQRIAVRSNSLEGALLWDAVGTDVTFTDNHDVAGAPKDVTVDPTASLLS